MDRRARTSVFLGLNRKPYIKDGEFRRMKNLSSDNFPYASSRTPYKEYSFDISVPGTARDGYDADVAELPDVSTEEKGNEWNGKTVFYTTVNSYEPGEFYYVKDKTWIKGIQNEAFKGVVTKIPAEGTLTFDGLKYFTYLHDTTNPNQLAYGMEAYESTRSGHLFKYLGDDTESFKFGKIYKYKFSDWKGWVYGGTPTKYHIVSSESEAANYKQAGDFVSYIGPPTESFPKEGLYICHQYYQGTWVEADDILYTPVKEVNDASEENENTQIRYVGEKQPKRDFFYEVQRDVTEEGEEIYFYSEKASAQDYEKLEVLPEAKKEICNKVFLYAGAEPGKFYRCDFSDGSFSWKETERPYVIKNVTLPSYAEEYLKTLSIKEVLCIHEHLGALSALIRADNGKIYLYYDKAFYEVKNISEKSDVRLISCGKKLLVGAGGAWLDTKEKKFTNQSSEFSFTVQADDFESPKGKVTSTYAGTEFISICSQDKALIDKMATALNKSGIEFEMNSEKQRLKYPYQTRSVNGSCTKVEQSGWGYKAGDAWIEMKFYKLYIYIEPVSPSWYRIFDNDEVYINSTRNFNDCEIWKKRLWGYYDNVIRGSAADIFTEDGTINWNRSENDYLDSIYQTLWQGGDITGIAALTDAMVFFKETGLSVMTGNYPAIMSASSIFCPGLKEQNKKSVSVLNDSVFYLSDDGVYRFSGGFPVFVSEELSLCGIDAVSGTDGRKYYISLKEETGKQSFYVYDVRKGLWHSEEFKDVTSFSLINGKIHFVSEGRIFTVGGDEEVIYEAEMEFDEETCKKKKYKELLFHGVMENCTVSLRGDDGEWQSVARFSGNEHKIKLNPIRCEKLSVRLSGKGKFLLKSLERVFEIEE